MFSAKARRPRWGQMTPEQFQDALDLRGPRLAEWPAHQSQAATELLLVSSIARDALAQAELLDGALSGLLSTPRPARPALKAAIFDALPPQQTSQILEFPAVSKPAPVPSSAAWQRFSATAAAILLMCLVGGICASRLFPGEEQAESIYVSAIYGDLAF